MEAWDKFIKAGIQINRLPVEDLEKFQRIAVPIWFKWANKDKDAARMFKTQLDIMESPSLGYVTPDMYKGQKLDL
jgi:TRAP-type C4-dicarboxylate transport system substrate-binding protein